MSRATRSSGFGASPIGPLWRVGSVRATCRSLPLMSERTKNLPRRSCLSVPGSSEKMLGKGPNLGADMVFIDLEDSVSPLEKEAARGKAVTAIRDQDWGETVLCVRVNAWDTPWTAYDILEVVGNAGERLEEIMLPKVQTAAEVVAMDLLLTQVEQKA